MTPPISDTELDILIGSYEPKLHGGAIRIGWVHSALVELKELRVRVGSKQAEIDRLMLEFCPDEMTVAQREEWAKHQRRVEFPG